MDSEFVFVLTSKRAKQQAKKRPKENNTSLVTELNVIAHNQAGMTWSEASKTITSLPKVKMTLSSLITILEEHPYIGLNHPIYVDHQGPLGKKEWTLGEYFVGSEQYYSDRSLTEWAELLQNINIMCYFWNQFLPLHVDEQENDDSVGEGYGIPLDTAFEIFMNSFGYNYTSKCLGWADITNKEYKRLKISIKKMLDESDQFKQGCLLVAAIHCGFKFHSKFHHSKLSNPSNSNGVLVTAKAFIECNGVDSISQHVYEIETDLANPVGYTRPEIDSMKKELIQLHVEEYNTADYAVRSVKELFKKISPCTSSEFKNPSDGVFIEFWDEKKNFRKLN